LDIIVILKLQIIIKPFQPEVVLCLLSPDVFPPSLLLTIHDERVPKQELHMLEEYELIITLGLVSFRNNPN